MNRSHNGHTWEQVAESFLRQRGLKLLNRNFRCRLGELDLVMQDQEQLVFVEVRYRRTGHCGSATESVDRHKRQRIERTAAAYLAAHPRRARMACRFDVVSIDGSPRDARVDWVRNAFESIHG